MEDFKLILYVLAAVAYFIFMQWRKAFNAPNDDADVEPRKQERRAPYPVKPATSFEDILRELQPKLDQGEAKGKAVMERSKEPARPFETPVAPVLEAKSLVRSYEDTAPRALSWEKPAEAMQAARNLEDRRNRKRFGHKYQAPINRYATLLRNPLSARDAVILTEIFNRKYD